MTMSRRLTVADVCTVTGYSRDELHATLKVLWPYSEVRAAPRVAREFTAQDMVVLCVTRALENHAGMRRTAVAKLGQALRASLSGPKVVSKKARLVISIDPLRVEYVDLSITEKEGVVVALGPIFEKVDGYLTREAQSMLPFTTDLFSSRSKTA